MMHDNLKKILSILCNEWHYRLTAIELVDAHLCTDPSKYISMLMLSLNTMLHLELPHINVLSKVDLIRNYGKLGWSTTPEPCHAGLNTSHTPLANLSMLSP